MRDRPDGAALLALARQKLLEELLPLLPEERRFEARLVAAAMAIAERETMTGGQPIAETAAALAAFYEVPLTPTLSPPCGEREALLRGFAHDLRMGAFEDDPGRESAARAILWRLTMLKLREANPRFLAQNGFT